MLDLSGIIILDQIFYKSSLKVYSKSFILKRLTNVLKISILAIFDFPFFLSIKVIGISFIKFFFYVFGK